MITKAKEYFKKRILDDPDYYAELIGKLFINHNDVSDELYPWGPDLFFKNAPNTIDDMDLILVKGVYFNRNNISFRFSTYNIQCSDDGDLCEEIRYSNEDDIKLMIDIMLKTGCDVDANKNIYSRPEFINIFKRLVSNLTDEQQVFLRVKYPQLFIELKDIDGNVRDLLRKVVSNEAQLMSLDISSVKTMLNKNGYDA